LVITQPQLAIGGGLMIGSLVVAGLINDRINRRRQKV
jgi:hypothetical protein